MILRYLIALLLVLFSFSALAQKQEKPGEKKKTEKKKKERTPPPNIEFFPKNFLFRAKFLYPLVAINVSDRGSKLGKRFVYLPAMPGVVGGAIKIKKVYISAGIQLPASDALKKKYGTAQFRNITINIRGRIVQWGMYYRDYQGFYLNNYKEFYPSRNVDSLGYPRSGSLRIREAGLNLGFNFNKSFSLNAAFTQGERQKKTAGSFLLNVSERFQRIDADTSFVPPGQGGYYPNLDKLKYGNFLTTLISAGVGFQFVVKKFHFTPVLMAGSGLQFQTIAQLDRSRFRITIPTNASAAAQIGYNGDHFFTNLVYQTEFSSIPIRESRLRLFQHVAEVSAGIRF